MYIVGFFFGIHFFPQDILQVRRQTKNHLHE